MDIRPINAHDDTAFRTWFAALRDAELHGRDHMPMWSEAECAVMFRHPDPSQTWTAYGAYDDGTLVGSAFTVLPNLDNVEKADLAVGVPPQRARRGVGTAIVEQLTQQLRTAGRTTVISELNVPFEHRDDHGYRRFAERLGFTLANVEIRRTLELPIDGDQLDAWQSEAAAHHADYRIETFDGPIPDELVESYCYLLGRLAVDAPTGDLEFEAEVVTPDGLREREKRLEEQGRIAYATLAISQQGDAVAHSVLCVPSGDPGNVYQWGTLVHGEHRGHRLGLATKVRNLRAVQENHPDRTRIITANSETNGPMVAINEQLGFTPVELLAEFQLKV